MYRLQIRIPNQFSEQLIFFKTKDTDIIQFTVEHYCTKTNVISYYLLPNFHSMETQ